MKDNEEKNKNKNEKDGIKKEEVKENEEKNKNSDEKDGIQIEEQKEKKEEEGKNKIELQTEIKIKENEQKEKKEKIEETKAEEQKEEKKENNMEEIKGGVQSQNEDQKGEQKENKKEIETEKENINKINEKNEKENEKKNEVVQNINKIVEKDDKKKEEIKINNEGELNLGKLVKSFNNIEKEDEIIKENVEDIQKPKDIIKEKSKNENKVEKDIKDKKEGYNMNQKDLNKLKEVFLNSFTLESKSEKEEKKEKVYKETDNNFVIVEDEVQYHEDMNNNNNTGDQKKGKRYEDILKFKDELNLKKKLKKFYLFYYQCKNPSDDKIIYKLGKVLVYTYRKNFPKIQNYKTKKLYSTDAWWGCMVRCGQMILSRGIYRFLKSKGLNTKMALYYTVPLFGNYPIRKGNLHSFFQGMLTKFKEMANITENSDKEIKEFYPPFSIKTLCDVGEIFERTAGEWFSDVIITGVFKRISEYFELFTHPNLNAKIMTFQSCIEIQDILDTCFIKKKRDPKNQEYIHFKNKFYYFDKMGIVFVNVRVGLDKIPKEYYKGIRDLFRLKECIGIIGGKTRLAYYFIGFNEDDDSLLYLDPHVTKEADKIINMGNILSRHVNKEIHLLKLSKMSTAFTIGFCFRNYNEFLAIMNFWLKAKQDSLPILGMIKQSIEYDGKDIFDEEDCSPTYEDKDEDDF